MNKMILKCTKLGLQSAMWSQSQNPKKQKKNLLQLIQNEKQHADIQKLKKKKKIASTNTNTTDIPANSK